VIGAVGAVDTAGAADVENSGAISRIVSPAADEDERLHTAFPSTADWVVTSQFFRQGPGIRPPAFIVNTPTRIL